MDSSASFGDLQTSISQALVSTTRAANRLNSEDLAFHRSLDRSLSERLDTQNARLLEIAQRLLGSAISGEAVGPTFPDGKEDLEHKWKSVVDVIDSLLERADTSLDEYTGVVKRVDDTGPNNVADSAASKRRGAKLFRLQELAKPQLAFKHLPQNNPSGPWKPLLTKKPHAKQLLQQSLSIAESQWGIEQYQHPYRTEIDQYTFPESVYTKAEPVPYLPYEETTATWVDTTEGLASMLEELKGAKEIAIDIEHHEHRTFSGLLSLMQISTRDKDWIVDTLKPWRRDLECLNEVFTDPSIVKVLHGAYMDVIWLQRDLGLYLVGLFDTHWAAKALGYDGGSLAFLLQKFVGFEAQKQYATADWRIRPLPKELFDYARSDTHFLLYIYDHMRNELIDRSNFDHPDKNKVQQVLEKSKETALQTYSQHVYDPNGRGQGGWLGLLMRTPAEFSKEQFAVFKAVHQWRDHVARQEDEGLNYLMSNHALFSIAREMPKEPSELLSLATPVTAVLRSRVDELLAVITKARIEGENGPEMIEALNNHRAKRQAALSATVPIIQSAPQFAEFSSAPPTLRDSGSMRSTKSSFWGNFLSSLWPQRRMSSTLAPSQDLTLAVPLPPLTAEIFADGTSAAETTKQKPELKFIRKEDRPNVDDDDEIFVIRELGQRKRKADEDPSTGLHDIPGDDAIALEEGMEKRNLRREQKAEAKRQKKMAKRALNADGKPLNKGVPEDMDAAPEPQSYDYENSPSVLKSQQESRTISGAKSKPTKGFDPFKKAMDAPKGLARARKPEEGRSKTFRN
ncbi:exosome complex exonuclease-like protein Rrp6 [Pseudovirgaria hyperparasitica]|uniref:Exosome complex exonuclease-like protein Rrp6 n=1 Tax=Pseudovirgaria hyperparasitica TaxID=470096 RepID=A0A6A6WF86_9PEZI|nr:exosome complex exonuclease-like protein Rrp6 [Pseudovirgaria hyperparasitica]KAF2760694.1 exosome complex exonuclease-like protein Rrp6 [Pseudovirgaria hyperparasitica]